MTSFFDTVRTKSVYHKLEIETGYLPKRLRRSLDQKEKVMRPLPREKQCQGNKEGGTGLEALITSCLHL